MKLSALPLRPTTLATFTRRGFTTTNDVSLSKQPSGGGIANLAAELGCTPNEAASLAREVHCAVRSISATGGGGGGSSSDDRNDTNGGGSSSVCLSSSPSEVGDGAAAAAGETTTAASSSSETQSSSRHHHHHHHVDPNPSPFSSSATNLSSSSSRTAASLILDSSLTKSRPIVTFCQTIDSLLGGGIARSELTEIVGAPGVGKTQLAMQLCVDSRLPKQFGGVEGESVYIDSEGSFSPERCWDMATSLVQHVRESADRRRKAAAGAVAQPVQSSVGGPPPLLPPPAVPDWFEPETILDGIHVFRVHDEAAQASTIRSLPGFLRERERLGTPVRLVVIDSIAFHYRSSAPNSDYKSRTRSLASIAGFLSDLAANYDVAVVAINQMTTKVGGGGGGGDDNNVTDSQQQTRLVPALGESWAHATTTRLLLSFPPGGGGLMRGGDDGGGTMTTNNITTRRARHCRLIKSPHKAAGTALYDVTERGVRDVVMVCAKNNESSSSYGGRGNHGRNRGGAAAAAAPAQPTSSSGRTVVNSSKRPRRY